MSLHLETTENELIVRLPKINIGVMVAGWIRVFENTYKKEEKRDRAKAILASTSKVLPLPNMTDRE